MLYQNHPLINPDQFNYLTFDCYGTLIDWERGILDAIHGLLQPRGITLDDAQIVTWYGEFEADAERGPYIRYCDVLKSVVDRFAEGLGFTATQEERSVFAESVRQWKPFPDTSEALMRLQHKYKLVILSNVDDELFASSARQMGVTFDIIVTAQQCCSYKPSPNNFLVALDRIGAPKSQVLHVAQSLYHDHVPAKGLGFTTVWVNRSGAKIGVGLDAKPDLVVPDLTVLADVLVG